MLESLFGGLLNRIAARIADLARGIKERVVDFITRKKTAKRDELRPVLQAFDDPYLEELGDAIGHVTGRRLTVEEMRRFVVGDVALSKRLYRQAEQTAATVARILREHVKYEHDARKLALELYQGYGRKEREVLNPRVRLPKYLDDALLNREMDALMARIQAGLLKTPNLRAAYLDLLDRIISGRGGKALDKAMDVAVQERYRYFANRIAQTELARAQNRETARELMADDSVEVVRYQLSVTHPAPDICDAFAYANAFGLGPGLYPKGKAPLPPSHPFCRCTCTPVIAQKAGNAREDGDAIRRYLAGLDANTARQVAGSKAKRDAALQGENLIDILNAKRPAGYRIARVEDIFRDD